ncbi:hypothetical protein BGW42_008320 [Actinomortierella wolfii]|nr:hypothetical protein BGW42_008320 [Actinomortierella wolfii]
MVMTDPMSTVCNHIFCRECIHRALAAKDTCPLCNSHITRRGLNPVVHLSKVIDCFNAMREAYEAEADICLSQAPRQSWNDEPQENLSQLYPYPEKGGTSREVLRPQHRNSQSLQPTLTLKSADSQASHVQPRQTQVSSTQPQLSQSATAEREQKVEEEDILQDELSCFDMNLDMLPAEEQKLIAEQMIRLVGQLSLGGLAMDLNQDNVPDHDLDHDLQQSQQHTIGVPSIPPVPERNASSQRSTRAVRQSAITQSDSGEASRSKLLQVKEEPSDESHIVLSVTSLSPKMKQSVQRIAKALNTPIVEGYGEGPTHVVTQSNSESSFKGVEASSQAGYWVKEDPHQVGDNEFGNNGSKRSRASHAKGEPKLLDGYVIQLYGKFTVPSRADLELLIEAGGGRIVEDLLEDLEESALKAVKAEEGDASAPPTPEPLRRPLRAPLVGATDASVNIKQEPEEEGQDLLLSDLPPTQVMTSNRNIRRRLLLFDADKISKRGQDQVLDTLRDLRARAQTLMAAQAPRPISHPLLDEQPVDLVACSNLLDCIAQYDMAQLNPLSVD